MKKLFAWIPRLWSNRISLFGLAVTSVMGCTMLLALAADLVVPFTNVYATTVVWLIAPFFFILGLLLMPVGLWLDRRRRIKSGRHDVTTEALHPILSNPRLRKRLTFFAVATLVNIILVGGAGYKAASFMNSPEFCGTVCHEVMQPEYEAYLRSPHSRVSCVDCHIGEGASWAVRSKLDGLRQVWRTLTDSHDRPVPSPVHHLRPARETCEKCHWPAKFHGSRVAHRIHYQEDEKNSAEVNVLVLKVGGKDLKTNEHVGIHWHVSPDVEIRYEALDAKREKIGRVTVMRGSEVLAEYLPPEAERGPAVETRTMDCVDCHNRPTHVYDGSPREAMDWALQTGLIDVSTPFIRKLAVPLLERVDRDRDAVEAEYRSELEAAYTGEYEAHKPSGEALDAAAKGMATLYRRNVFPAMKVGWDTYPTHLGHRGEEGDERGCFRCHNDRHETADGKVLSQDCELCHQMLAEEEAPEDLEESLRTLLFGRGRLGSRRHDACAEESHTFTGTHKGRKTGISAVRDRTGCAPMRNRREKDDGPQPANL